MEQQAERSREVDLTGPGPAVSVRAHATLQAVEAEAADPVVAAAVCWLEETHDGRHAEQLWVAAAGCDDEGRPTPGLPLPARPLVLAGVRALPALGRLSAVRPEVLDRLAARAPAATGAVGDRLWDCLVWALASDSEGALRTELEQLVRTDALTGLLNRRGLAEALDREVARARRDATVLSFVLLDVDSFKTINDTMGHAEGDRALTAVADLLRRALRAGDVAGRWGGDEFALVFAGLSAERAQVVVDRLRATWTHPSYRTRRPPGASFSAGVTALTGLAADQRRLLEQADKALYTAKGRGGSCSVRV